MKNDRAHRQQPDDPLRPNFKQELGKYRVSSRSLWSDPSWILDSHRVRSDSEVTIKWAVALSTGDLLTDAKYHQLLDWLKKMVWSLMVSPGDGYRPMSPGTIPSVSIGLARLVPWMVDNHIMWPIQFTQDVLDQLYEDLPQIASGNQQWGEMDDDDGEEMLGPVRLVLNIIFYIWRQRKSLQKAAIAPMPSRPWPDEEGANSLVLRLMGDTRGWTPPLADEVAIPLLNAATSFLEVPASDIQVLLAKIQAVEAEEVRSSIDNPASRKNKIRTRLSSLFSTYSFSAIPGSDRCWHGPLNGLAIDRPMFECRRLLLDLISACCVVISGFAGLRGSELEELVCGVDQETGLPTGVRMKQSATGLNEEFVLVSGMPKGSTYPARMEWLLGSRRRGDTQEPHVIRAMRILDDVLQPYRKQTGSDRLVLFLTSKTVLVESAVASRLSSGKLKRLYAKFMKRQVDLAALPDTSRFAPYPNDLIAWRVSKGDIIKPGALRKTFASYVLSTSPELLPAVKRQFQHMSMSMTEGGYWGTNLKQVEPVSSVSRQMTARMLYELTQDASLGGKMGRQVEDNIETLRALVSGVSPGKGWRRIVQWVEENGLEVNHAAHGDCIPVAASRMDCWAHSGRRPVGALVPNYETRNVSMCVGCQCFLMSERHAPFWEDRLRAHEEALEAAERMGVLSSSYREVSRRASQARNVLKSFRSSEQEGRQPNGNVK